MILVARGPQIDTLAALRGGPVGHHGGKIKQILAKIEAKARQERDSPWVNQAVAEKSFDSPRVNQIVFEQMCQIRRQNGGNGRQNGANGRQNGATSGLDCTKMEPRGSKMEHKCKQQ